MHKFLINDTSAQQVIKKIVSWVQRANPRKGLGSEHCTVNVLGTTGSGLPAELTFLENSRNTFVKTHAEEENHSEVFIKVGHIHI